ncbi:Uncharacterised protein [Salmonella enterica subsp. enterica]|nr:Uncharacterised protein [Salmonella enterica subsp. enterica]
MPHDRFNAVAAHENIRRPAISLLIKHRNVIRRLADIDNMGRGTILHARVRQHRFPYRCMNIYPVNYRIRPAKMVAERLSGFNAYHFFGIHGIHHGNVIGKHRTLAGNIAHTETIQRRKSVRPS